MHLKQEDLNPPPSLNSEKDALRVLITIQTMESPAGGSLYVRDFAEELQRQGHYPAVYCPRLGVVSDELIGFGIPVTNSVDNLEQSDVIHGNSPIETAAAVLRFPRTPALYVCHGWDSPDSLAPKLPSIVRYLAVSEISRDRLVYFDGVSPDLIWMHYNPVDLARFRRREPLSPTPSRALVFSNTLTGQNHLRAIELACAAKDIALDAMGLGVGKARLDPERVLGEYDVVFARGRCALEAVATGCAVILCDALGFGELLTTENFRRYRTRNFGRRCYLLPPTVQTVLDQLAQYDPTDADRLTTHVREAEGLFLATQALVDHYRDTMKTARIDRGPDAEEWQLAAARFLGAIAPTANTFYIQQLTAPLERRVTNAERRLLLLADTLAAPILSPDQMALVALPHATGTSHVVLGVPFQVSLAIHNGSEALLASLGLQPIMVSYHWLGSDGEIVVHDGERTEIYPPLPPGGTHTYVVAVLPPASPGRYILRLTLVQEGVAWMDNVEVYRDLPCVVRA